jgi:hypothetical protein
MTISLTHKFHSAQPDDPDATLVRPSNWNDQHALTGTPGQTIVFDAGGNAAEATPGGGGNVSTTGTPTNGQLAQWTDASHIQGVSTLPSAALPALTGDVTTAAGSAATSIAAGAVSNAKLATMAANTVKGNNTAGTAAPVDLTRAQLTALCNAFTTALSGDVPASGGGTSNFLRADGNWAAPAAGSGAPGGSNNSIQYNNAGAFGGLGPLTNGQLLIGSTGAAAVPATLTAGSNVTITNAAGAITIASTGGGSSAGPADAFVATLSADQTGVVASTQTKINFNVASYNQNGKFFTTGANAGRWIPSAGPVQIEAQVTVNAPGVITCIISKNGTLFKQFSALSAGSQYSSISIVDTANGTDYYECWMASSVANTVLSGTNITFFQGFAIAPQGPAGPPGLAGAGGITTTQTFLSGSGTYTKPANALWIEVFMIGGGAGGSSGNNTTQAGGNGGNTTFGSLTAGGGSGAVYTAGGAGGTASGGTNNIPGGSGSGGAASTPSTAGTGGAGGNSVLGGGGAGVYSGGGAPVNAATNSGGGGGGGATAFSASAFASGAGGGAGGYCYALIANPAASYSYAVGAGGLGNTNPGANGLSGGNGAAGIIIVKEYYGGPQGAQGPQGPQGTPGPTTPADAFVATLSADQTGVAANTWTKVNFNTSTYNQNGKFNTSNGRWTPSAGPVQIEAQLSASASATTIVGIYKNGTLWKQMPGSAGWVTVSVVDTASGTDYYECWVFLGTAASITSPVTSTFFQGFAIAPQGPAGLQGPQGVPGTPGPTTPADAFVATLSADQTGVGANTPTKVNFNVAGYNQNGKFSTSTSRWIPSAGPVQIEAQVYVNTSTSFIVFIYKNGAVFKQDGNPSGNYLAISVVDNANGTDYYECWIQSAVANSILSLALTTFFQAFAIAPQGPAGNTGPTGPVSTTVPNIRLFTASGTYTPSANLVSAIVECIGGGAAGGGNAGNAAQSNISGGGGSGAYSRKYLTTAQIGASQAITIGAGGVGVSTGNGGNGGTTSFGSLCTAPGGSGGGSAGVAGAGAAAGTGDVVAAGAPGQMGTVLNGSGILYPCGASGGSGPFGGGGVGAQANGGQAFNGGPATNYGSGGSGSCAFNVASNTTGGNGSAGVVIVTEYISATAPGPSTTGVLPKQLAGLTLANDATTPNTVLDIDVGSACSDDNQLMMVLTTVFTKNCNAGFVAGSGNGALDTGSALAASTWYHVFLIMRTDTGAVDVLISTSATAPSMPGNYSKKRRVGSIKTNASSQIIGFSQVGDQFLWNNTPAWDVTGLAVSTTPTLATMNVPLGVKVIAQINAGLPAGVVCNVFSPDTSAGISFMINASQYGSVSAVRSNTSSQVLIVGNASATGVSMVAIGWIDNRGK